MDENWTAVRPLSAVPENGTVASYSAVSVWLGQHQQPGDKLAQCLLDLQGGFRPL